MMLIMNHVTAMTNTKVCNNLSDKPISGKITTIKKIEEDTGPDTMSIYFANFLGQSECKRILKDIHDLETVITEDNYEAGTVPFDLIPTIILNKYDTFETLYSALDHLTNYVQVALRFNRLLSIEYFARSSMLFEVEDLACYVYTYSNVMSLKLLLRYPKAKKVLQENVTRLTSRPKMDIISTLYKNDIIIHDFMIYEFVKMMLSRQYYRELLVLNEYDHRIIGTIESIYTDSSAKCLLPYLDKFQTYMLKLNL